jgi:hypothetical protein
MPAVGRSSDGDVVGMEGAALPAGAWEAVRWAWCVMFLGLHAQFACWAGGFGRATLVTLRVPSRIGCLGSVCVAEGG